MVEKFFSFKIRSMGEIFSLKRLNTEKIEKSCIISKVLSRVWFCDLKFICKYGKSLSVSVGILK